MVMLRDFIGRDFEELEDFLMHEDLNWVDMTRISKTDRDCYFFYSIGEEREDRCIEVYFNSDNIVIDVCEYNY